MKTRTLSARAQCLSCVLSLLIWSVVPPVSGRASVLLSAELQKLSAIPLAGPALSSCDFGRDLPLSESPLLAGNGIHKTGDFNGDGKDEFIVTSNWGIGILQWTGNSLRSIMMAPNDTWFGAWRWDTRKNAIKARGDFNGDGKADILVISDWGIGILTFRGGKLVSLVAKPNGTGFGTWNWNSAEDRIHATGDFNGDGRADIVVSSPWGIGILTLRGGSLTTLVAQPGGTRIGAWNWNSARDRIHGTGDFNGDGKADLLVSSPWGIGILTFRSGALTSLVAQPSGTRFGAWNWNVRQDRIRGVGDFNGDGMTDLVVTSPWGIGILTFRGGTLASLVAKPDGTRFGAWNWNVRQDRIRVVGDFNGDGKTDLAVTSPWGIGILTFRGGTLASLMAKPNGTRFGGWVWQS